MRPRPNNRKLYSMNYRYHDKYIKRGVILKVGLFKRPGTNNQNVLPLNTVQIDIENITFRIIFNNTFMQPLQTIEKKIFY